jgi:hypothetical protein
VVQIVNDCYYNAEITNVTIPLPFSHASTTGHSPVSLTAYHAFLDYSFYYYPATWLGTFRWPVNNHSESRMLYAQSSLSSLI